MFRELWRLVKHSGLYGTGIVLSKAVGFLMIPVYTRFLTPQDYGVLELLDVIIFFASMLAALGIYASVFRFYALYQSRQDKQDVISTAFVFNTLTSLGLTVLLAALARPLAQAVLGNAAFAPYVRIVALTFFFSNVSEVPLAYWRAQERTRLFVCASLARTLLGTSLLALALAGLQWGIHGAIWANLVANGIAAVLLSGILMAEMPPRLVADKLREMLRYGIPLLGHSVAMFVLVFSDRFFLRHFGNLTEVGVYALGYKLGAVVAVLVSGPFHLVWQWQQFEVAKREDARLLYAKIQTYQLLVVTFFGLAISVLARDAIELMADPSYWAAHRIVPIVVLSYLLQNVSTVISTGIYVQRTTHSMAAISVVVVFVNLLLNYFLVSRFLAMGAAIATALSFLLQLVLSYWAAQRVYPVPYEYSRSALVLGSGLVIYGLSTLPRLPLASSVLLGFLWLGLFAAICFLLLDQQERAALRRLRSFLTERLRQPMRSGELGKSG